jgi:hypothetical protein
MRPTFACEPSGGPGSCLPKRLTRESATEALEETEKSQSQGATVKLADLRVTKVQSSRWQKIGALEDDGFESRVAIAKEHAV